MFVVLRVPASQEFCTCITIVIELKNHMLDYSPKNLAAPSGGMNYNQIGSVSLSVAC